MLLSWPSDLAVNMSEERKKKAEIVGHSQIYGFAV
jgi:hypothetical protein